MAHAPPLSIHLGPFVERDDGSGCGDLGQPTSAKMQDGMQPPSPIDGVSSCLGNMRVAYRVDGRWTIEIFSEASQKRGDYYGSLNPAVM